MACGDTSVSTRVASSEYDDNPILVGLPLLGCFECSPLGSSLRLTSRTIRDSVFRYLRSGSDGGYVAGSNGVFFPRRIIAVFPPGYTVGVDSHEFGSLPQVYQSGLPNGNHFVYKLGFTVVSLTSSTSEPVTDFIVTPSGFTNGSRRIKFNLAVYGALYLRDIPRLLPLSNGSTANFYSQESFSFDEFDSAHSSVLAPALTVTLSSPCPGVFEM